METVENKKEPGTMFSGTAAAAGVSPIVKKIEASNSGVASTPAVSTPTNQTAPPAAVQPKTQAAALRDIQNETTIKVLEHVQALQEAGDLKLPENYAAGNQVKLAWLNLLEVTDRAGNAALAVCTKESIANALLEMIVKGLSVSKKQCNFIVYGNKLTLQEEYHGTIALAKRFGGLADTPEGNIIYDGDIFEYEVDAPTGRKRLVKHIQKFENIDLNKIVGAYTVLTLVDGKTRFEVMNMGQIRQAWMQGATKGQSPAHKNFPDQMAVKTVINRACKLLISSSDDSGLYKPLGDENVEETPQIKPDAKQPKGEKKTLKIVDIPHTDVTPKTAPAAATPAADGSGEQNPGF